MFTWKVITLNGRKVRGGITMTKEGAIEIAEHCAKRSYAWQQDILVIEIKYEGEHGWAQWSYRL